MQFNIINSRCKNVFGGEKKKCFLTSGRKSLFFSLFLSLSRHWRSFLSLWNHRNWLY